MSVRLRARERDRVPARMAVIAFVVFWVLVALGLLFIAISGGPGGARERLQTQSRSGRKGAFVDLRRGPARRSGSPSRSPPASASTTGTRSPRRTSRASRAQEQRGRELFSEYCRLCHTLEAAGVGRRGRPEPRPAAPDQGPGRSTRSRTAAPAATAPWRRDLVVGEDAEAVAAFVSPRRRHRRSVVAPESGAQRTIPQPRRSRLADRLVRRSPVATLPPSPLSSRDQTGKRGTHIGWGESDGGREVAGGSATLRREPVS